MKFRTMFLQPILTNVSSAVCWQAGEISDQLNKMPTTAGSLADMLVCS